ncbi:NUDIX hydrolase [Novosphingobium sp. Chol11]|uniref:NUDIX hydrolase n=1 Tax=Novosphingobium sp. Chol11 TaxID=1385763 RepID=UPI000BE22E62|nr:NUDIX hydrolase [Novosphingobium sp. Chol11]
MAIQSAAIPYRYDADGQIQILLVTSRRKKRWVLPKGHVRQGMGPHSSAAKKAFEEGGVIGRTSVDPIADYERQKKSRDDGELLRVQVYPMEVTTEAPVWPEMHQRERQWLDAREALLIVHGTGPRNALAAFNRAFNPGYDQSFKDQQLGAR